MVDPTNGPVAIGLMPPRDWKLEAMHDPGVDWLGPDTKLLPVGRATRGRGKTADTPQVIRAVVGTALSAQRQPSPGATYLTMLSRTWALYSTPS